MATKQTPDSIDSIEEALKVSVMSETIIPVVNNEVPPLESFVSAAPEEILPNPFKAGDVVYQSDPKTLCNKWHGKVVKTEGTTVFLDWEEFKYKEPLQYEASELAAYN